MVPWFSSSKVLRFPGSPVLWFSSSVVLWFTSSLVLWFPGSLVLRFPGSLVLWFPGSLVLRFPGSPVLWFSSSNTVERILSDYNLTPKKSHPQKMYLGHLDAQNTENVGPKFQLTLQRTSKTKHN